MKMRKNSLILTFLAALGILCLAEIASAQDGFVRSYLGTQREGKLDVTALQRTSLLLDVPEKPRTYKKGDKILVVVSEKMEMQSDAEIRRRKRGDTEWELAETVSLGANSLTSNEFPGGSPGMIGGFASRYNGKSEFSATDELDTEIACQVASDPRSNGYLEIQGLGTVMIHGEQWKIALSGLIDPKDIDSNGAIKSRDIMEKIIRRETNGQGKAATQTGWLTGILDRFSLF